MAIETTELDFTEVPPPPPAPPDEETSDIEKGYIFVPYDESPEPIGGFLAIQRNLVYPDIARRAGVEGAVIIAVLLNEKGEGIKTQILKSTSPNVGFEEAAREAVLNVKWKPAMQRDKPVKVWVSIPVTFRLKEVS